MGFLLFAFLFSLHSLELWVWCGLGYPVKPFLSFSHPSRKSTFLTASLCICSAYFCTVDSTVSLLLCRYLNLLLLSDRYSRSCIYHQHHLSGQVQKRLQRTPLHLVTRLSRKFYKVCEQE